VKVFYAPDGVTAVLAKYNVKRLQHQSPTHQSDQSPDQLYSIGATKMSQFEKLIEKILNGYSDSNIFFLALCQLLCHLGFEERIKGSHHIFTRYDVVEILNLQPKNSKAKAYQVKQVREVILKYHLGD